MTAGFHLVAFRVTAAGFMDFLDRLPDLHLNDHAGTSLTRHAVRDHTKAFSIYFSDPYGHRLEITTYDHAEVRHALAAFAR
jgi:hypothetical protein